MVNLPMKCLGMPLGAKYKDVRTWEPIVARFEKRLAEWKRNLFSKSRWLTLIKSTLTYLPIYYMFLLSIPKSVAKKLEPIQSRFLLGDSQKKMRNYLVAWYRVERQLNQGG